jgi:hypothetical protein
MQLKVVYWITKPNNVTWKKECKLWSYRILFSVAASARTCWYSVFILLAKLLQDTAIGAMLYMHQLLELPVGRADISFVHRRERHPVDTPALYKSLTASVPINCTDPGQIIYWNRFRLLMQSSSISDVFHWLAKLQRWALHEIESVRGKELPIDASLFF